MNIRTPPPTVQRKLRSEGIERGGRTGPGTSAFLPRGSARRSRCWSSGAGLWLRTLEGMYPARMSSSSLGCMRKGSSRRVLCPVSRTCWGAGCDRKQCCLTEGVDYFRVVVITWDLRCLRNTRHHSPQDHIHHISTLDVANRSISTRLVPKGTPLPCINFGCCKL